MFIQENYFKNIFNTVREGILILDENMRVLSANRSFFSTFKAVVAAVTEQGEDVEEVSFHVEKLPNRFVGIRSTTLYPAQLIPADDSQQRDLTGQLNKYYDVVISHLRDAAFILIFGPGEAKGKLIKRIERDNLSGRVAGVEIADRSPPAVARPDGILCVLQRGKNTPIAGLQRRQQ